MVLFDVIAESVEYSTARHADGGVAVQNIIGHLLILKLSQGFAFLKS